MSYDLHIWSSGPLPEKDTLLEDAGYRLQNDAYVREGDGWLVAISRAGTVDAEDVPDAIMRALPGIAFMTEINISAPERIQKETLRLCNALAKEMKGIVEDDGMIKLPAGVKKVSDPNYQDRDRAVVSLIWNFDDAAFHQSDKLVQFIDALGKYAPDALPRRYGEFEPPQYKYAETGKAHLVDFLKNDSGGSPVWYATKPFTHMFFSVPNSEKEAAEIAQLGLTSKSISKTIYGRRLREYRCGHIELQMLQDLFFQPDWNLAAKRLFAGVAKALDPFHAEVLCNRPGAMTAAQHVKLRQQGRTRSWWWQGVPRDLGYALMLDKRYTERWKRFAKASTPITDTLYMVDCFGELCPKSVRSEIGLVPMKL